MATTAANVVSCAGRLQSLLNQLGFLSDGAWFCGSRGFMVSSPVQTDSWLWEKSKALLGGIGPITRARVSDLLSDDVDRPAGPRERAAGPVSVALGRSRTSLSLDASCE